jgi:hypothetical protein
MPTDKLTPAMRATLQKLAAGAEIRPSGASKVAMFRRMNLFWPQALIRHDGSRWVITTAGHAALAQQEKPNA